MTTTQAEVTAGIQATMGHYARALDEGRTDDVVALFTPDGTAEIVGMGTFQGQDAIRGAYAALAPTQPQLHLVANTVLTAWDEDEATAISSFVFLQRGESGWATPVTGRYDDTFRKSDEDGWLIRSRTTTFVM